jgi:hypothetical protein
MRSRSSTASVDHLTSINARTEPIEPLTNLLVGKILAALQRCFTLFHSLNKAGLFGKIAADRLLRELVRVAASLVGKLSKLVLLLRGERYFHKCQSKSAPSACQ